MGRRPGLLSLLAQLFGGRPPREALSLVLAIEKAQKRLMRVIGHEDAPPSVGSALLLIAALRHGDTALLLSLGTPATAPSALPIIPGRRRHAPFLGLSLAIGDLTENSQAHLPLRGERAPL